MSDPAKWIDYYQKKLSEFIERNGITWYLQQSAVPPVVVFKNCWVRYYSVIMEFVLELPLSGEEIPIIAKIRREASGGEFRREKVQANTIELACSEYDELSRTYEFFLKNTDDLSVVRPLGYVDAYNTILIEKASGEDLAIQVRRKDPDLLRQMERSGRWLHLYHTGVRTPEIRPFDSSGYLSSIDDYCQILRGLGVSPLILENIQGAIRRAVESRDWGSVSYSMLHGDYKLRHILVNSRGIQVIDFGNILYGPCLQDVAAFLVELEVLDLWRPLLYPTIHKHYARSFLEGYFEKEVAPPVLSLKEVEYLMKKWGRRLERWSTSPFLSLNQKWLERCGLKNVLDRRYLDRWFAGRVLDRCRNLIGTP